jgi:hypothetical protein
VFLLSDRASVKDQQKSINASLFAVWASGPRILAWDELWRRILMDVLEPQELMDHGVVNGKENREDKQ